MEQQFSLDALAVSALDHFDIGTCGEPHLINLSENATFKIDSLAGESWALRIHRLGYQNEVTIASELAWAIALRDAGVAITPIPVQGRDRTLIQQLSPSGRLAVLTKWESGAMPEIADSLESSFEKLGALAARMHGHARSWQRPSWFTRQSWDFQSSLGDEKPLWGRWCNGLGMTPELEMLFERTAQLVGSRLRRFGKSSERFGLIHGDTRLANLLIDGTDVKILDFDDCGFGWFMYDAATTVSFHEHEPQVPALLEAWKTGYRKVATLSLEDEAEIPTFIMLRRLLLVAWIGSHSETELAQSMGMQYAADSRSLCDNYLSRYS